MFSFVEDTVLDPFLGTGSTVIAAIRAERNSIGNELDPTYFRQAETHVRQELAQTRLFAAAPTLTVD
jgi:site-specific DNA-methyltransferase (adenine-specific)